MRNAVSLVTVALLCLVTACDADTPDSEAGKGKAASFSHATADDLSGTFFYLLPAAEGAEVWSYANGDKPKRLLSGDANLWASATPSPDGRYISYVDMDSKLRIWDVRAKRDLEVTKDDIDANCQEPVWTPDAKRLLIHTFAVAPPQRAEWLELPAGESTEAESAEGCHIRFGGDSDVYSTLAGDLSGVIMRDGGEEAVLAADVVADRSIIDLVSVALDNAAMCVTTADPDEPAGDAARSLTCDTVIDTKAREPVELPGDITNAVFPATGGIITRAADGMLTLSDGDDKDIAMVAEPKKLAEGFLLGYAETD